MTILPKQHKKNHPYRKEEKPERINPNACASRVPIGSPPALSVHPPPRKISKRAPLSPSSLPCSSKLSSPRGISPSESAVRIGSRDDARVNSDDEYERGFEDVDLETRFEDRLKQARGLHIKKMVGDGSCLFRAVADQVYGDEEMHSEVRKLCLDYMEKNRDHFEQFMTEDFLEYIARKRRPNEHGNHMELQAISEMYNRPIEIYEYNINPINVFHPKPVSPGEEQNAPLRLSYHGTVHYNSVIDPYKATIGVGLGLPGLDPGSADRNLLDDAIRQSDLGEIEQAMLSDKMKMTDWQRTEEDMKEQVARESYIEYVTDIEKKNNKNNHKDKRVPPPDADDRPSSSRHPPSSPIPRLLPPPSAGSSATSSGDASRSNLYEELLAAEAFNEWGDEDAMLAEALLLSQQTYLSDLRGKDADRAGSSKN